MIKIIELLIGTIYFIEAMTTPTKEIYQVILFLIFNLFASFSFACVIHGRNYYEGLQDIKTQRRG